VTYSQWLAALAQLSAAPDAASQAQWLNNASAQTTILTAIYNAGFPPSYVADPPYAQLLYAYLDISPQSGPVESGAVSYTGDPVADGLTSYQQKLFNAGYIYWWPGSGGAGQYQLNTPAPASSIFINVADVAPYSIGYPGAYINPNLWTFDPFYGCVTPQANVRQSVGWEIYDSLSQKLPLFLSLPLLGPLAAGLSADIGVSISGSTLGSIVTAPNQNALLGNIASIAGGALGVPSPNSVASSFASLFGPPGVSVDSTDFIDDVTQSINNAPGFDFGASSTVLPDYITGAYSTDSTFDVITDNPTVNDLLNGSDEGLIDSGGVLPTSATGINAVGDSASLTDENGSVSNNNSNAPKGGGASIGNGQGGGAVGPSTANTPNNTAPVPYLPPNPRALQSATQALYNPQGGGLYPIYNPSANNGTGSPFGSSPVVTTPPGSVAAISPTQTTMSNMLQNPLVLVGMGVVALILLMK
jgi:hypothetical protein